MCGFVGILERGTREDVAGRLRRALDSLSRRGPDSEAALIEEVGAWRAALGHRRLKIIDLDERASQPYRRGDVVVLLNGEIYNYVEIREELLMEGATFVTQSDTEVAAAAYERWGSACVRRFDGMFALVILDHQRGRLTLARDPFGEKPLYVAAAEGLIAFGSTAESLRLLLGERSLDIDPRWVAAYLQLGFAPAPLSVWKGIEKLSAGEVREIDLQTGQETTWEDAAKAWLDEPIGGGGFDIMEFEALLIRSIERRLRADVPLGILLSGGIDSAYLTALIGSHLSGRLTAVTIHDRLDSTEEIDRAAKVCGRFGVEHQILRYPSKPLHELIAASLPSMDEPIGDPAYPVLVELFSQVPRDIRVVLTGDGADELFLSYTNYRRLLRRGHGAYGMLARMILPATRRLSPMIGALGVRLARRMVIESSLPVAHRLDMLAALGGPAGMYQSEFPIARADDRNEVALWRYSLELELPEYLLVKADRASMHHSFESRTPYLNRELFQYLVGRDPETLALGGKSHITQRLNSLIGEDFGFTKRGFFASGQETLARGAIWHPRMSDLCGSAVIQAASDPRRTDATSYYRLHVLNEWLNRTCA
ncbi:MAG: asparagine synthase (glutamine-hydrolyzing) [Georgfuchsia sp.]